MAVGRVMQPWPKAARRGGGSRAYLAPHRGVTCQPNPSTRFLGRWTKNRQPRAKWDGVHYFTVRLDESPLTAILSILCAGEEPGVPGSCGISTIERPSAVENENREE